MTLKALTEVSERTAGTAGQRLATVKSRQISRLGLRVPVVRELAKTGYSFTEAGTGKSLKAWDYIWRHSGCYEVMSQALYSFQYRLLDPEEVKTVLTWADRVECWEHSDDLAKIYADALEADNRSVVPTLKKWNKSDNAWKRRLSMTSLIEYEVKRRRVLPYAELIAFVEPLMEDDEYYVQKGLGWTVREIGNAYPKEFRLFMQNSAHRLSPQAWSGATRNLDKREKAEYMTIRRSGGR